MRFGYLAGLAQSGLHNGEIIVERRSNVLDCGDKALDWSERERARFLALEPVFSNFLERGGFWLVKRPDVSFEPVSFSSRELPELERIPVWREFWGRSLFGADIEPFRDAPFHVEVTARFLPDVGLISTTCSPSTFSCVPSRISDDSDGLGLIVASDKMIVRLNATEIELEAGDAVVMATTDAASMSWYSAATFRCILVSRAALAPLFPDVDKAIMRTLAKRTEALQYLLGYMRFIENDGGAFNPQVARSASLHLCNLFMLAAEPEGDNVARYGHGMRAARLEAMKQFTARHCGDCRLTVRSLASHFRVTPRYVQRLFENDGSTFSNHLLGTRLTRAREMLAGPQFQGWSVSAIAFEAGFGDISYFNRCFRRRFGASPTELRNDLLGSDSLKGSRGTQVLKRLQQSR